MKRTGPTKKSTRMLARQLKKAGTERKQEIWKTVSEMIEKPRRQRPTVNLEKLARLSGRFKGKIFLVGGKVLGTGSLETKLDVAALEFSQSARGKIIQQKGKCWSLPELLMQKEKPANIMIVK